MIICLDIHQDLTTILTSVSSLTSTSELHSKFRLLINCVAVCKLYTTILSIIVFFYKSLFIYSIHVKCNQCRETHPHFSIGTLNAIDFNGGGHFVSGIHSPEIKWPRPLKSTTFKVPNVGRFVVRCTQNWGGMQSVAP